ncbi:MAG: ABC transporter permease [Acidobacteria bacterium]|nr:ABC transporter permease [Acidobacteriota bacterium]
MGRFLQDLRFALRTLRKRPGFTLVAVLTLGLGIGANSAIFSVVDAVLLRPLPYPEPEKLVRLWETFPPAGWGSVSAPNIKDWREQNTVFSSIAAYSFRNVNLSGMESPERVVGAAVSSNFFATMGVAPQLGRWFEGGEDTAGSARVAVLSDRLWRRNYAADPSIIGREIQIGGEAAAVIGVMPAGFRFPSETTEIWTPLVYTQNQEANRGNHAFLVVARLGADATLDQADEQMKSIARRIEEQYPQQQSGRSVRIERLKEGVTGGSRQGLLMLSGAVFFVLLIACVNVANLLLARAAGRRRELAIRAALGAGRSRLVFQFLTESLVLSGFGGLLGLAIGKWGVDLLMVWAIGFLPRAGEVALDARVVVFTFIVSLLTGIAFGLAPALRVSRTDLHEDLKEGGRSGDGPRHGSLRKALVVAEIALALVLLAGAGLLIRSFQQLQRLDTGMQAKGVLTLRLTLPESKYPAQESIVAFHRGLLERIAALPGVEAAGMINMLPLVQSGFNGDVNVEGRPEFAPGQSPLVEYRAVSPDYFRALGVPLIAGRFFNAADQAGAAPAVIINSALARALFPDEDAVGKRMNSGVSDWTTIVGVVGDVRQSGLTAAARPELYLPYAQAGAMVQSAGFVVRAQGDPLALAGSVRGAVRELDPAQPVYSVRTMEDVLGLAVADRRLNMLLLGLFAALAMVLAAVGIYGVMSYTVSQSTREIGIRMALGAERRDIVKLIVGQGAMLTGIGIAIGLGASMGLAQLIGSLLYGVSASDPLTYAVMVAALTCVALLACYVPARRATRVDPMIALRSE